MTARIRNITLDSADPWRVATFWSDVLGLPTHPENEPEDDEVGVQLGGGDELIFARVPEPKIGKNRVHLCLEPDQHRDAEVERLLGLGAVLADDRRNPDGTGWAVLRDIEGNEFCVLRSAAERG